MATLLIGAGAVACAVSWLATWGAASIARRLCVLDYPGGYKQHATPTPLLGGLGVATGTLIAMVTHMRLASRGDLVRLVALGVGATIILFAGVLDDVHGLAPRRKFAWQVGAAGTAGLCLAAFGVHLDLFLRWPPLPIALLTAVWVVAITNAVNFLDNMDGLCAGIGAIDAWALALIAARQGESVVALSAAALGGACLGFLPHNWPRPRIFLGDTGAMLIGFLLAALSVMGVYTRAAPVPVLAVLTPLCVLAIPTFDAIAVVAVRMRAGHPPWVGDRRHINHRLVHSGWHPAAAIGMLWAVNAVCAAIGVLLPTVTAGEARILLTLLVGALGVLAGAAGTKGLS